MQVVEQFVGGGLEPPLGHYFGCLKVYSRALEQPGRTGGQGAKIEHKAMFQPSSRAEGQLECKIPSSSGLYLDLFKCFTVMVKRVGEYT